MFALHVVQAEEGDCLILQDGDSFALIDGGPAGTYGAHLARAIGKLKIAGFQLVVVSHVDGDHIEGLLEMIPHAKPIAAVWHNAFSATVGGEIEERVTAIVSPEPRRTIEQGSDLAGRIGSIPLNPGFRGGLVSVESAPGPLRVGGADLLVVGPDARALGRLRKDWLAWIALADKPDTRGKARPDTSVTNRSSIVLFARSGKRTMLLTGDARADEIVSGLGSARLLDAKGKLHVDLLKVQHHGSQRNASADFFRTVTADRYVVSANGRYDNPDLETLTWIVDAAEGRSFELVVTNLAPQVKDLEKKRPQGKHHYSIRVLRPGDDYLTVTPQ